MFNYKFMECPRNRQNKVKCAVIKLVAIHCGVRTYVEAVLAAMSQILAVLSAEALRSNLLSALQDSCNNKMHNNIAVW